MGSARDKGNRLERDVGKFLQKHDGEDEQYGELSSSTGRVGHLPNLQADVFSRTFAVECKARKDIPKWLQEPWQQILDKSSSYGKIPLMVIKANRVEPMYIITQETFKELISNE